MRSDQRGAALLELAIVLPLLLFVVLGALELARLSRFLQFGTVLAREAVSLAYRRCSELESPPPAGQDNAMERCLEQSLGSQSGGAPQGGIQALADALDPNSRYTIILSIYGAGQGGAAVVQRLAVAGESVLRSKFSAGADSITGPVPLERQFIEQRGRVAIAEVYYPFTPLIGSLPGIGLFLDRLDYYDAAVL